MSLSIRVAESSDAGGIAEFNAALARETEGLELDRERVRAGVAAALADPTKGVYLLAEIDGRVVGQLMITVEWSDWRNGFFWWIQSVYVEPSARRRGVFRALQDEAARRARGRDDVCGLRLYVERENAPALRAYDRLGWKTTAYRVREIDFTAP